MGGSEASLTSVPPWGRPALELELAAGMVSMAGLVGSATADEAAGSGSPTVLPEEFDVFEESAAPVASGESTGASGGVAEEQATNKNEVKIIRTSAFQAIAKPSFR